MSNSGPYSPSPLEAEVRAARGRAAKTWRELRARSARASVLAMHSRGRLFVCLLCTSACSTFQTGGQAGASPAAAASSSRAKAAAARAATPAQRLRALPPIEWKGIEEHWEIHWDSKLGEGAYGEVFRATSKDTGAPCCVKTIRKEKVRCRTSRAQCARACARMR